MKDMSSTEAKTHFGALLDMAQREPVTIHKKGRAVAVMLSMQDFEAAPRGATTCALASVHARHQHDHLLFQR